MADPDLVAQWGAVPGGQQSVLGGTTSLGLPLSGGAGNKYGDNSLIYMPGSKYTVKPGGSARDTGDFARTTSSRNTITANDARREPLRWMQEDPEMLKKFVNSGVLNKVPGFDVGMGMPEIMQAWDKLLEDSWMMNKYMPGGDDKKFTPWDVLNSYSNQPGKFGTIRRGDWEYDIATGEKVKYVGPKSKTRTDTKVDLSSPEDVKAITTNALSQLLGRAPTADELAKFRSTINNLEQQNPVQSITTENYNDMGEVTSSNTSQSGGLSGEARAQAVAEGAKKGPEYGKFQSGTTYWGALMQMMGGG